MTGPAIDPLDQLKAMKAQAAPPSPVAASPDPLDQLKAMKAAAPVVGGDPNQKLHDEFKSGNLATRMARENENDAQSAAPGVGEQVATHVLNAAQGIPGVRAVEAGAGALGSQVTKHPMGYQQSLKTLDSATGNIDGKTSFAEKALGGMAVAPFLPANAVKAGALFAGADRALSADPESLADRAVGTAGHAVVGGAVGGVVGRVAQGATTAVRAGLAQNPADNVLARQAERALSAKRLFSGALNEGQAHGATQAVRDFLAEPDIAARVQALQGLQQFKQTPAESPEMLDALYKSLSDEAKGIQKGLAVADPSKPNTGRFREGNVKALKDNLLGSVEAPGAGGTPPMMPSYRTAVEDFAQKSGDIDALGKGMTASQAATKPTRPTFKNITSKEPKTPQTFAQWAQGATDSQKQAASQGILGDVKNAFHEPGKTLAPFRRATSTAPGLLRSVGDNTVADILQNMGIASTLSPFSK